MSDIVQTLRQLDQQIEKLLQENYGLRTEVDRRRAEVGRLGERVAELERQVAAKATPATDGHEWQPVDADHPLTAEDDGRLVRFRSREEWTVAWVADFHSFPAVAKGVSHASSGRVGLLGHDHANDIIAVLRPKPAPEPPKPLPGEVWESVVADGETSPRHGEIVSTRKGLACLVDVDRVGDRQIAFAVGDDGILRSRNWLDRKLTRRVS